MQEYVLLCETPHGTKYYRRGGVDELHGEDVLHRLGPYEFEDEELAEEGYPSEAMALMCDSTNTEYYIDERAGSWGINRRKKAR